MIGLLLSIFSASMAYAGDYRGSMTLPTGETAKLICEEEKRISVDGGKLIPRYEVDLGPSVYPGSFVHHGVWEKIDRSDYVDLVCRKEKGVKKWWCEGSQATETAVNDFVRERFYYTCKDPFLRAAQLRAKTIQDMQGIYAKYQTEVQVAHQAFVNGIGSTLEAEHSRLSAELEAAKNQSNDQERIVSEFRNKSEIFYKYQKDVATTVIGKMKNINAIGSEYEKAISDESAIVKSWTEWMKSSIQKLTNAESTLGDVKSLKTEHNQWISSGRIASVCQTRTSSSLVKKFRNEKMEVTAIASQYRLQANEYLKDSFLNSLGSYQNIRSSIKNNIDNIDNFTTKFDGVFFKKFDVASVRPAMCSNHPAIGTIIDERILQARVASDSQELGELSGDLVARINAASMKRQRAFLKEDTKRAIGAVEGQIAESIRSGKINEMRIHLVSSRVRIISASENASTLGILSEEEKNEISSFADSTASRLQAELDDALSPGKLGNHIWKRAKNLNSRLRTLESNMSNLSNAVTQPLRGYRSELLAWVPNDNGRILVPNLPSTEDYNNLDANIAGLEVSVALFEENNRGGQ